MLEERAFQLALAGNDKLLTKVLAAKFPAEYRESIKIDLHQTPIMRMDDAQIDARLKVLLGKLRPQEPSIDAEIAEPAALAALAAPAS